MLEEEECIKRCSAHKINAGALLPFCSVLHSCRGGAYRERQMAYVEVALMCEEEWMRLSVQMFCVCTKYTLFAHNYFL